MPKHFLSNISPVAAEATNTRMTDGIVFTASVGAAGLKLTVGYARGGRSFRIFRPSNAPTARYELGAHTCVAQVLAYSSKRVRAIRPASSL